MNVQPLNRPALSLKDFSMARYRGTPLFQQWATTTTVEDAERRAQRASIGYWMDQYYPAGALKVLTADDVRALREAWLIAGRTADEILAMFTIGWRLDRWEMPDAELLATS